MSDIRSREGSGNQMRCFRDDHEVWTDILNARRKAYQKHGANSIEAIPASDPRWLSILMEEVGEAAHELTYDSGGTTASLRAELIDVLSVASAWVDAIDAEGGALTQEIRVRAHHNRPSAYIPPKEQDETPDPAFLDISGTVQALKYFKEEKLSND